MIPNGELQQFMCQKYDFNCDKCLACIDSKCSFDKIGSCLKVYLKEKWGGIINED